MASEFDSSMKAYMKEIAKTPLLTPEEEVKLAKKIKKGDQAARTLMSKARFFLAKGDATGGAQALRDAFEALKDKNVLEARKAAKMTCVLLRAGKKGEAAAAAVEAEAAALKLL